MEKGSYTFAGIVYLALSRAEVVAHCLRREALIHPTLEKRQTLRRPRFVARHAAVRQARVNLGCPSSDVLVAGKVQSEPLHGIHVGTVAKQWPNIVVEA